MSIDGIIAASSPQINCIVIDVAPSPQWIVTLLKLRMGLWRLCEKFIH